MDVTAAGTGSPAANPPVRLNEPGGTSLSASSAPGLGAPATAASDAVGAHLEQLSSPQIHHLLSTIEGQRFSPDAAMLDGLLRTAHTAAAQHDIPRAMGALAEYIGRNPEHASALLTTPSLGAIQGDVKEMLRVTTLEARTEAVRLIGAASVVWDAATRHAQGMDGAAVLAVAGRFVESGQLANYIRAAELSQAVIAYYGGTAPEILAPGARRKAISAGPTPLPVWDLMARMWRRVPVLVLLLGWLVLGLAGATLALVARVGGEALSAPALQAGVEVWAVGFLALVVFQFFVRLLRGG